MKKLVVVAAVSVAMLSGCQTYNQRREAEVNAFIQQHNQEMLKKLRGTDVDLCYVAGDAIASGNPDNYTMVRNEMEKRSKAHNFNISEEDCKTYAGMGSQNFRDYAMQVERFNIETQNQSRMTGMMIANAANQFQAQQAQQQALQYQQMQRAQQNLYQQNLLNELHGINQGLNR